MVSFTLNIKGSPHKHILQLLICCSPLSRFGISLVMEKQFIGLSDPFSDSKTEEHSFSHSISEPCDLFSGYAIQEPRNDSVYRVTKRTYADLTIFSQFPRTWAKKPRTRYHYSVVPGNRGVVSKDEVEVAEALLCMKYNNNDGEVRRDEEEEKESNDDEEDPWKIKKMITKSDVGGLSRLMVGKEMVKNHILPFLDKEANKKIENEGHEIVVWDVDTRTEHELIFKKWVSSNCYIFLGGWIQHFVKRRGLIKDDEIGLHYDRETARFYFTVLKKGQDNHDQE